jgi:hypothetical protein
MTTDTPTTSPLHAAALALAQEAHKRGNEPIFPGFPAPSDTPRLIECLYEGRSMTANIDGDAWHYDLPLAERLARPVLALIHMRCPRYAAVFLPAANGAHRFLGYAERFAVERGAA